MKRRKRARRDAVAADREISREIPWYLPAAGLAILVLSVYWQVGGHAFLGLDDDFYVAENRFVLRGLTRDGVSWAFSTFHASNWHPLTWLSHMADVELFGPSAGWHHRVNVLLHLLNAELLFFVLWRMTGGLLPSAFVAALFGVHPLHVESVAWVAERKDVLSTLFFFLAMGAYLRYVRRPGTGRYLLLVASFALGLLTKPMVVTLPFVLLLLDVWPLGRLGPPDSAPWPPPWPAAWRLAREKLPLFALSAASCAVTYLAQSGTAVMSIERLPIPARISNALVSYVVYLGKAVWPSSLAVFYPHPATIGAAVPAWQAAGSIALLCGLSVLALRQVRRRPCLAVGWLWYVGTLVPVIGLVQVGAQAHADRYTYVPLIGIFIAVAWGVPSLFQGGRFRRQSLAAFAGVSLAALAAAAWVQAGYWRDTITLLSRAVAVTEGNWAAWNNLGVSYNKLGRYREAIGCLREAARIAPGFADSRNNLGVSYNRLGEYEQAVAQLREALRIRPGYADALNNLGISFNGLGRYEEAVGQFRDALGIKPGYAEAWNNLGVSYSRLGRDRQAIDSFREALRLEPDYVKALNNLGALYGRLGRYDEAIVRFREALRLDPGHAEVLNNLGMCFNALGRYREAVDCFREALRLKPDYAAARINLAAAVRAAGPSR